MEAVHSSVLQWTLDFSVGCAPLDHRNRALLNALAATENVITCASGNALAVWLQAGIDQFGQLLDDEERVLAAADYPELIFCRPLHDERRRIAVDINRAIHYRNRQCIAPNPGNSGDKAHPPSR